MGYGLGPASNGAFDGGGGKRAISFLGDGGFWHNGLSSSIGNMVYNKSDSVAVIVDNYYSAATGGQDVLSSRADNPTKSTNNPISKALKGIGVDWVRQIDHTYDVSRMRDVLREALTTDYNGPKVIVASSECMLNRQRREKPIRNSDGTWTEATREAFADRIEAILRNHIRNFDEIKLSRRAYSPADLAQLNMNLVGGDPYGGQCTLDQFFIFRPFSHSRNGATPASHLYHIGASTHPGPGLGGGSGYNVAKRLGG